MSKSIVQKAQASTEFLIILSIVLVVFLIMLGINSDVSTNVNFTHRKSTARVLVDDLADASILVYQQGIGSKTKLYLTIPRATDYITIANQTFLHSFSGQSDVTHRSVDFTINGSLPSDAGSYWVTVESLPTHVQINLASDTDAAPVVSLISPSNAISQTSPVNFTCSATDDSSLSNIELWSNFSSTWQRNASCSASSTSTSCTWQVALALGSYLWACMANDSAGNENWAASNYTLSVILSSDTAAPSSVTNLQNISQGISWIYWTWSNPADEDFNETIIYLSGTNVANTSGNYYNATGLSASTSYTINVHTKDHNNNINSTDVTSAASTLASQATASLDYSALMVYYDAGNNDNPRYRYWNSTWSSEALATSVGSSDKRWYLLEAAPTRNEMILGVQDNNNDLNLQVWNGTNWSATLQVSTDTGTQSTRAFDIAYEHSNGRALVAFVDNADQEVPRYVIWDGSSWSSEASVNTMGSNQIRWIRLESNPTSNEIMLVALDGNEEIHAQTWNGSQWSSNQQLETETESGAYQTFDVAYEHSSGRALVAWSDTNDNKPRYRIWNGSWSSENAATSVGSTSLRWLKLASNPASNEIALATVSSTESLTAQIWNSTAWVDFTTIDNNIETDYDRAFDLAYESLSGTLMLAYGNHHDSTPVYYTYDGSWSSANDAVNIGNYPKWVVLAANSTSDEMMLMISDSGSDISIQRWTGSSWTDYEEVESQSANNEQAFDIKYRRD